VLIEVDAETLLGEGSLHRRRRLHLQSIMDVRVIHAGQQLTRAVGGISIDSCPSFGFGFGFGFGGEDVGQQQASA
jgi:hypothetical protein